jgi:transcriptional regulator with XRE-family HTH domain
MPPTGISARHLSFIETGRSQPSPEMILRLAEQLEVPVRERNQLLLAAGYAPAFSEHSLADPVLAPVREALDLILTGHEPYPALVVDRRWNMVAANSTMAAGYPTDRPEHDDPPPELAADHIVTPLIRMRGPNGEELSLFATVATFGGAAEVTTSELSIELTFPADAASAQVLRNLPHR